MDKDIIGKIIIWIEAHPTTVGLIVLIITTIITIVVKYIVAPICKKQQNKRDKIEKDREYIQTHIEKELIPLTSDKYVFKKEVYKDEEFKNERKLILVTCGIRLLHLKNIIPPLSYSYMFEYFDLLEKITKKTKDLKNISDQELTDVLTGLSINFNHIKSLLLLDEDQYKKEVPKYIETFVVHRGQIRDNTLKILKDYPQYEEVVLKSLEKQNEKQKQKEEIHKKAVELEIKIEELKGIEELKPDLARITQELDEIKEINKIK